MKKLSYIFILVYVLSSCTKTNIILSEKDLPEDVFYLPADLKPYTGQCTVYYTGTKVVKAKLNFKNGILHGSFINFYRNGNVLRKGEYNYGKLNGKWEKWDEKGKKVEEVNYKNDKLAGHYVSWFCTGVIEEKGIYTENLRKGVWIKYDQAGMIVKMNEYN